MNTEQLTPELHKQLKDHGIKYLRYLDKLPGSIDPGASTIFVYEAVSSIPENDKEISDIDDEQIVNIVNEEIDFVEIHVVKEA